MKKYILSFLFSIIGLAGFGQTFTCNEFQNDLSKYEKVAKDFKSSGNKKWAKELYSMFPCHNDGTITYEYIVRSDSIFNIEDLYTNILNWYKIQVPNCMPNQFSSNTHLSYICTLMNMGRAIGYMNATFINAKEEITIDIKENKVKILVKILQYISANTWQGAEVVLPNSCFPCNPKGSQKDSHAMAFINCHSNALNTISSFIKYLNDNISIIKNGETDW